jgi:hypothetical protein
MEKYTAFAHKGTGCNPFVHVRVNKGITIMELIIVPILTARLVLGIVILFTIACLEALGLTFLANILSRILLLVSSGILVSLKGSHQNYVPCIYISNYQSPLDILSLNATTGISEFTFPCIDRRTAVVKKSVISALFQSLSLLPPDPSKAVPIESLLAQNRSLVLFPCGAKTNGTGLLSWPSKLPKQTRSVICLKYSEDVSYTCGGLLEYLLFVTSGFNRRCEVFCKDVKSDFRKEMLRMAEIADTDIPSSKSLEFLKFYDQTQNIKYLRK